MEGSMYLRSVRFVTFFISMIFLVSCGQYDSTDMSGEASGGITARLVFPGQVSEPVSDPRVEPLVDLSGDVETVVFSAIKDGVTEASAAFAYSAHQGTLSGIPVGQQYMIRVEAQDSSGNVKYRCSDSAVKIEEGVTTDIGTLHMISSGVYFIDSGQALADTLDSGFIALGDLDGDGDLDSVMGNFVWLNDGTGVFTDSGQSLGSLHAESMAVGDVDGDGDLDLVNGIYNQANLVWLNNGAGVFTDSGQSLGSNTTWTIALGDVDGDGDLDLVEGNTYNNANLVWLNNGTGVFTDSGQSLGSSSTYSIALGDVDGDGDLDMIAGNYPASMVWFNNGAGVFTDSGQSLGSSITYSIALGDMDGDGDLDLVEGNFGQANLVWLNNGAGVYTNSGQYLGISDTYSIALGDIDGDGDLDMAEGNNGQANLAWLNNGAGILSDLGQSLGNQIIESIALGDVDGDGDLDVVEGNYSQANLVWFTNGTGSFSDSGQRLGGRYTSTIVLGDVDGDDDLDLVAGNTSQTGTANLVWLNNGVGVFTDSGQLLGSSDTAVIALGDVDGDGDQDLVEGTNNTFGNPTDNTIWLNNGSGTFTNTGPIFSNGIMGSIALGDVDSDGDLDVVGGNDGQGNLVWLNQGYAQGGTMGEFTDSGQSLGNNPSSSLALGDVDGDGDLDVVGGNDGQGNLVWLNQGYAQGGTIGVFTDSGQQLGNSDTISIALGDVDGDGDLDLVEGNDGQGNLVWKNSGTGSFTNSGQYLGNNLTWRIVLGDVDGDGDLDLVEGNNGPPNIVWFNDGAGVFTDNDRYMGSNATRAITLGDVDGDGDLDLAEGNFGTPDFTFANYVWLNR
jgi:hypothetical protein